MATDEIPKHVADFLSGNIDSVIQLEVLLLLHGAAEQQSAWRSVDVARELRIDPEWTEAALAKLSAAGVLARDPDGTYRYSPRAPENNQTIATLARIYLERRVTVIAMIFAKPPDPIRQFTDAFRFRKDEPPDQERGST